MFAELMNQREEKAKSNLVRDHKEGEATFPLHLTK